MSSVPIKKNKKVTELDKENLGVKGGTQRNSKITNSKNAADSPANPPDVKGKHQAPRNSAVPADVQEEEDYDDDFENPPEESSRKQQNKQKNAKKNLQAQNHGRNEDSVPRQGSVVNKN